MEEVEDVDTDDEDDGAEEVLLDEPEPDPELLDPHPAASIVTLMAATAVMLRDFIVRSF